MPFIGERLGCARERSNREDPFAVAIKRGTETVDHVPCCRISQLRGKRTSNQAQTQELHSNAEFQPHRPIGTGHNTLSRIALMYVTGVSPTA